MIYAKHGQFGAFGYRQTLKAQGFFKCGNKQKLHRLQGGVRHPVHFLQRVLLLPPTKTFDLELIFVPSRLFTGMPPLMTLVCPQVHRFSKLSFAFCFSSSVNSVDSSTTFTSNWGTSISYKYSSLISTVSSLTLHFFNPKGLAYFKCWFRQNSS